MSCTAIIGTSNAMSIGAAITARLTIPLMIYDGKRIASIREARGMTQAELAKRAKISQPSLWALEHMVTKEPKHSTLASVAKALAVPLSEILRAAASGDPTDSGEAMLAVYLQLDGKEKQAILAAARAFLAKSSK